jgi:uncharacterized protein YjeT (DUF2065 family)
MSLQLLIEWFTALLMLVVGISHVLQPRLWAGLFIDLLRKPYAGLFIGTLTLPLGLFIVLGHNMWVWHVPVLVTLFGWGSTIKGTLYLLYPAMLQKVARRHLQHPQRFAIAGAALAVVGGVVAARLIQGP